MLLQNAVSGQLDRGPPENSNIDQYYSFLVYPLDRSLLDILVTIELEYTAFYRVPGIIFVSEEAAVQA